MQLNKIKSINDIWWSLILGIAAFIFITGGRIINPTDISWLMSGGGDPAQHYMGWVFFRNSPLFQWPLGANPNYGMEISGAIAHTDSLPLIALIFKPFSRFLPEVFQYTGLWIFISFLLQSVFSWKLLSLFTKDRILPLIGSAFFLLAPIWLLRMGGHNSSFGQWAIVAGLYFYLRKEFKFSHWLLLLLAISMLNTYIFMMTMSIYIMDLFQRALTKQLNPMRAIMYFISCASCIVFVLYSAGYFMVYKGLSNGGYGIYRMNLLSIVDPNMIWSILLPDISCKPGDWEGFNYLGLGIILMIPAAILIAIIKPATFFKKQLIPLFTLSVILFIYAISNNIGIGQTDIINYELPSSMSFFANAVRCSGRFFWPVYYLIYAVTFYLLFKYARRTTAIIICSLAFVIQIADFGEAWIALHRKFSHPTVWTSQMTSPIWKDFPKQYKKLIFVMPVSKESDEAWCQLSYYAATNKMAINTGYFSRVEFNKIQMARAKLKSDILSGHIENDALYLFGDDAFWNIISYQVKPSDIFGTIDGFRVYAPNFKYANDSTGKQVAISDISHEYDFNDESGPLYFKPHADSNKLAAGWSEPESWGGVWSNANVSFIYLYMHDVPRGDVQLLINAHSYVNDQHTIQNVEVSVNGHHVDTLCYTLDNNNDQRRVNIPHHILAERNGIILIEFKFPDAISPKELYGDGDERLLGLGIVSLGMQPINSDEN